MSPADRFVGSRSRFRIAPPRCPARLASRVRVRALRHPPSVTVLLHRLRVPGLAPPAPAPVLVSGVWLVVGEIAPDLERLLDSPARPVLGAVAPLAVGVDAGDAPAPMLVRIGAGVSGDRASDALDLLERTRASVRTGFQRLLLTAPSAQVPRFASAPRGASRSGRSMAR